MESIGKQVNLPLKTAMTISLQGIRIRLGRALVTLSGVVLGIAFLMSVITGKLITDAMAKETALREKTQSMTTVIKSQVGTIEGKRLALVIVGAPRKYEEIVIAQLLKAKPEYIRYAGTAQIPGLTARDAANIADQADLLIIFGDGLTYEHPLADLKGNMRQNVVVDTEAGRTFAGASPARELFFGSKEEQARQLQDKREKDRQDRSRTTWIVVVSLLVTVIGITNALLMSVTERFKEIGTMKCLGALSSFIRQLFLIESAIIGLVGSLLGVILGALIPMLTYSFTFGISSVFSSLDYSVLSMASLGCLGMGVLLSILAAIYPATYASRMVPAMALRSNV